MKESFVFYRSFYEAIQKLPEEYQLELMQVIMKYNFEEELPKMSPVVEAMFTLIKPNIDKASERYERCVENGKKGGRPKTETKPKENLNETKKKPNENQDINLNDNDNDNDNDNVNDNNISFINKIKNKRDEYQKNGNGVKSFILATAWAKQQPEYEQLTDEERRKLILEV